MYADPMMDDGQLGSYLHRTESYDKLFLLSSGKKVPGLLFQREINFCFNIYNVSIQTSNVSVFLFFLLSYTRMLTLNVPLY